MLNVRVKYIVIETYLPVMLNIRVRASQGKMQLFR